MPNGYLVDVSDLWRPSWIFGRILDFLKIAIFQPNKFRKICRKFESKAQWRILQDARCPNQRWPKLKMAETQVGWIKDGWIKESQIKQILFRSPKKFPTLHFLGTKTPSYGRFSQLQHFWPRQLCVRHPRWRLQCVAGHCYYQLSVFLSLSFFSPPSFAFDPLQGNSRAWKFVSPNILAKLEDICKNYFCWF